jgi:hypothetical protein
MNAGRIGNEHRALIEEGLITLRDDYLEDLSNLEYSSAKQIADGLTKIQTHAASLRDLLADKAFRYALMQAFVCCNETLPNTGALESEAALAKHEDDMAGVSRLHALATAALGMPPTPSPKPTAAKPELARLTEGILQLWTDKLGRRDSDARGNLLSFVHAIFEYIRKPQRISEEAAAAQLKKARRRIRARDAEYQAAVAGIKVRHEQSAGINVNKPSTHDS